MKIYASRTHLLITLLVILLPFAFLLLFSRLANIASGVLFKNLSVSLLRMITAYFISAILAWACAVLFYKGKRGNIALPMFDVLQSIPTFAALPFAVYYWGASNLTVIFFLVIAIIWPIFFSAVSSLKLIKHDWEETVQISGLRGWSYFKYFLFPVSIPGLITGSIIGLGDGWEALVATEIIVGNQWGLGSFFKVFQDNAEVTFFGILGLLLIVFSINKLVWLPLLEWSHKGMEE